MQNNDYYSVMEVRIKYLAKKYDPSNKFPLEWEVKKEEEIDHPPMREPAKKSLVIRKFSEVIHSIIAFLF